MLVVVYWLGLFVVNWKCRLFFVKSGILFVIFIVVVIFLIFFWLISCIIELKVYCLYWLFKLYCIIKLGVDLLGLVVIFVSFMVLVGVLVLLLLMVFGFLMVNC